MEKLPTLHNVPVLFATDVADLEDMPIYRYMPIKRLCEMAEKRENVLVSPSKWKDDYEAAITKVPARWYDGSSVDVSVYGKELFAQCWCADASESELRWKYYDAEDGVRIGTTVGRLLESVDSAFLNKSAMFSAAAFGKVCYLSRGNIDKMLEGMNPLQLPESITVSMFLKREEFRQEEEWRLLIRNCETFGMDEFRKSVVVDGSLLRFPLPDAKSFVSEILLGCSVSEEQENMLRNTLVKAGWRAVISRSGVNEKPQFFTSY